MSQKTVVVGMSGGVDSSVSALLLKQMGYRVIGMFMKNWEEKNQEGICSSTQDAIDAAQVCKQVEIPFYTVNFTQEYFDSVFTQFIEELKCGHTPNPDILCNREIKFKMLMDKALNLGADYLATGHYAQISPDLQLVKGADPIKDQSYFLYTLKKNQLNQILFPIGHLEKHEVRSLAERHQLATAKKKDSTGICFIGKRDFRQFISQYIAYQKGDFETLCGKVVGQHEGFAYYTIGQRKGLGVGGPGDAWFVVGKDPVRNVVYIEQGTDHPALYASALIATETHWISGIPPITPFPCTAKIRYRQTDQDCVIERVEGDQVVVRFIQPQRAITPRQSIVFYLNSVCLGGGFIRPLA